jgi:eukaryotic-like serine/threonine-protein kinase
MSPGLAPASDPRAWKLAEKIKSDWRAGMTPSAAAVVAEHPHLGLHRSIVIDLAYEEYLLREKGGAAPDPA